MARLKLSILLPILVFSGIVLGSGWAELSNYLNVGSKLEKALADLFYKSYLNNWENIRADMEKLHFRTFPLKVYPIMITAEVLGYDNKKCIYEFIKGIRNVNRGKYDKATQNFERVFHAKTPYLDKMALLYYGYCKQVNKDYESALEKYNILEKVEGEKIPEVFYNLANIYEKKGNWQKAKEYRQKYESIIKSKN